MIMSTAPVWRKERIILSGPEVSKMMFLASLFDCLLTFILKRKLFFGSMSGGPYRQ